MQISNGLWALTCAVAGYWLVSVVLGKLSEPKRVARPSLGSSNNQEIPKDRQCSTDLSIEQRYRHVLGVSYDAEWNEIKTAYKQLLAKYHPDKVTHLGDDFLTIAERKTKELVEAYDFFKKKYEL